MADEAQGAGHRADLPDVQVDPAHQGKSKDVSLFCGARVCRVCAERLQAGIKELGLELFVEDPAARLPTVNTIKVR